MSIDTFDFPIDEIAESDHKELSALELKQAVAVTQLGRGEDARPTIEYFHKKLWIKAPNDPRYPGADIWLMPDGSLWAEEALQPGHEVRRFHKLE